MKTVGIAVAALVIAALPGCGPGGSGGVAPAGDWTPPDPGTSNIPLSTAIGTQDAPRIISDGAGGAIVAWTDGRFGAGKLDIFAQRVDAKGQALWSPDGVIVTTAAQDQMAPRLVSDGAGGAVFAWQDNRNGLQDIYAQRLDATGSPLWTLNGIAVCTVTDMQLAPDLIPAAGGGAVIAWVDGRTTSFSDIYVQRINGSGTADWAGQGVAVTSSGTATTLIRVVPDAADGAVLAWLQGGRIFAQRINGSASAQWTAGGIAISDAAATAGAARMVPDGAGGVLLAWEDDHGTYVDLRAQRVDATGAALWTAGGAAACVEPGDQREPDLASDGAGGCVLAWSDRRGAIAAVYAQRLDASGNPLWISSGVGLAPGPTDASGVIVIPDGSGGLIVGWAGGAAGASILLAQRLDGAGSTLWPDGGVVVRRGSGALLAPQVATNGAGGAVFAWADFRSGADGDIFAQPLAANGSF